MYTLSCVYLSRLRIYSTYHHDVIPNNHARAVMSLTMNNSARHGFLIEGGVDCGDAEYEECITIC